MSFNIEFIIFCMELKHIIFVYVGVLVHVC